MLIRLITGTALMLLVSIIPYNLKAQSELFETTKSQIHFISEAPLEIIKASSSDLKGIIKPKERTFAFAVPIRSFQGFNSPLQQTHFNENYLETHDFPRATFSGKIIEQVDLSKDGAYTIRAKGILDIHGQEQERIIKIKVIVKEGLLQVTSFFTVLLEEHDIAIPRIVHQKIAEEIKVTVEATFKKQGV